MHRLLALWYLTLLIFLSNCDFSKNNYKITKDITDFDTAYEISRINPSNENIYNLGGIAKKYCQKNLDTASTNELINKIEVLSESENSAYIRNIAEQTKSFQQFVAGNIPEARKWARKSYQSGKRSPDSDMLDIYHLMGISYYTGPMEKDSVLKYWKLGFQTAIEKNDNYRIYFFATNIGAFFYTLNMASVARQYFLKALQYAKITESVSPMLLNNILTTLLSEGNNNEAYDFYKEHEKTFSASPTDYESQTIFLNRVCVNQIFRNIQVSDSLLRNINTSEFHSSLKTTVASLFIQQYIIGKDEYFINDTIKRLTKESGIAVIDNMSKLLPDLSDPKLNFLWETFITDSEKEIQKIYNNEDIHQDLKPILLLLIEKYQKTEPVKSEFYKTHLANLLIKSEPDEFEIVSYINEVKNTDALFKEILIRDNQIKFQKKNTLYIIIILGTLLVLLVVLLLYFRNRYKLKHQNEQIILREKDILLRENTMNNRIVEFSKNLIAFNKKIKTDIDKINFSADNTEFFKKFRSDLLGFLNINIESNPKTIDIAIQEIEKEVSDSDKLSVLNKTEKRVFVLIKEGFKANEIAQMLGVSTQYIYNLKAKLKRLNLNLD